MITYRPKKISLANTPTPLRLLGKVSEQLGGPRIWVKHDDATGSALSGNKVRKLEYVVAEAIEHNCDTLITCGGLQSNHCRATALVAAQLGLNAHLVLRGRKPAEADGNLVLDHMAGAEISYYSPAEYIQRLPEIFSKLSEDYLALGRKAWCIPTGASDEIGIWGYIDAAYELYGQLHQQSLNPRYIVCATGSGGTQAGLSLGMHSLGYSGEVVGMAVCDSEEYFLRKARKDMHGWQHRYGAEDDVASVDVDGVPIKTLANYIGPGYARTYPEMLDCIKWLARTEGIVLDPCYTGKAFYGLVEEIRSGRWSEVEDIVFVHTGGIFGLFPYRAELF